LIKIFYNSYDRDELDYGVVIQIGTNFCTLMNVNGTGYWFVTIHYGCSRGGPHINGKVNFDIFTCILCGGFVGVDLIVVVYW